MSYLRKRYGNTFGASSMGDVGTTVTNLASAVGIAADLANDPYLPETMCRMGQLKAVNAGQKPPACATTAMGLRGGVGLQSFIKPLRGYVYAEQNPWVYTAAVVGLVGLPLLLGIAIGRRTK